GWFAESRSPGDTNSTGRGPRPDQVVGLCRLDAPAPNSWASGLVVLRVGPIRGEDLAASLIRVERIRAAPGGIVIRVGRIRGRDAVKSPGRRSRHPPP